MRMLSAILTLASRWLYCALQVLLITSVLFAGVLPTVTAQDRTSSEETDSPAEEEEQAEELAKLSEQQLRYSKGNFRRWHNQGRSACVYSTGPRHVVEGHCLANGLRAPLLH